MDVTDAGSMEQGFAAAEARVWSGQHPDQQRRRRPMTRAALDVAESDWASIIDTNLKGAWLVAQHAARRMVHHGIGGSIVNIASILGLRVAGGVAPYAISKAGVVQMTKVLALGMGTPPDPGECPRARLYRD